MVLIQQIACIISMTSYEAPSAFDLISVTSYEASSSSHNLSNDFSNLVSVTSYETPSSIRNLVPVTSYKAPDSTDLVSVSPNLRATHASSSSGDLVSISSFYYHYTQGRSQKFGGPSQLRLWGPPNDQSPFYPLHTPKGGG